MPDWLKQAIAMIANFAQRLPDTARLTIGNGPGPITEKTKEEQQREADDNGLEYVATALEQTERQREREREVWDRQTHSFGNVAMTGAQWGELGTELQGDGALRRWLIERLMKDGKSREEAESKADEIADLATLMSKPASQLTPEEREKIARGNADPEIRKVMPELAEQQLTGAGRLVRQEISQASQTTSVENRADLFASAPNLRAHHQSALAAAEPLDAPKQVAEIVVLQKPTPAPASAGLEI